MICELKRSRQKQIEHCIEEIYNSWKSQRKRSLVLFLSLNIMTATTTTVPLGYSSQYIKSGNQ